MPSPTALSLSYLRRDGFTAEVVERWIPRVGVRRDLFHFADIIGVRPGQEPRFLLVQTTSIGNIASRLAKAKGRPELRTWLRAGGCFEVHGWNERNEVKRVAVEAHELTETVLAIPRRRRKGKPQAELFTGAP